MGCRVLFLSLLFATMLLFGCIINVNTPPTNTTKQTEQNISPIIKTFECPNGKIVTNVSDCPTCPLSCDKGNPCTIGACNISTNYSCVYSMLSNISCGENKICEEGVCKENRVEASNFSENLTQNQTNMTLTIDEKRTHLENESRAFIKLINEKRMSNYQGRVVLTEDYRLNYFAKKCNEEMLKYNKSDLTFCYDKFGSFRKILNQLGFYGDKLSYSSEIELSEMNSTSSLQALYGNLTTIEQQYLVNQSLDRQYEYPFTYENIGVSIDCNDEKCIQTTVTAGNKIVARPKFDSWMYYRSEEYPIENNLFVPVKYTLKAIDVSVANPTWCEAYLYQNRSALNAASDYWWSDYWNNANYGHSYQRKITWTDYYSENIDTPTSIYGYCYKSGNGRVEITEEYLPTKRNYTDSDMDSILLNNTVDMSLNDTNSTPVAAFNNIRYKLGFSKLVERDDLNLLTQSCVDTVIDAKTYNYDYCFKQVFGNQSRYPFSHALAARGLFGSYSTSFSPIENINNGYFEADEKLRWYNFFFSDWGEDAEYIGYGKKCDGDLCFNMFVIASNTERVNFTRVKKTGCPGVDNTYSYPLMRWLKGDRAGFDLNFYPNISITLNSSVPSEIYIYKNKFESSEIWNGQCAPQIGYVEHYSDPSKNWQINLSSGAYTILYAPKIKSSEDTESLNMTIKYTQSKKYAN